MQIQNHFHYSTTLSHNNFTKKTFTYLIILSYTSKISISYSPIHTQIPTTKISSNTSKITPLTIQTSSSNKYQLKTLLISHTLTIPSIITKPSFYNITSSTNINNINIIKSPTISSKISSTITNP